MFSWWRKALLAVAVVGLLIAQAIGLWLAPVERYMGDVYRIIYVHVPVAWVAMLAFVVTFVASLVFMWKGSWRADALAGASAEVGVVFGLLAIVLGSIWGRAAWDIWWTWDPRLTSTAVLVLSFAGYLALRQFVEDVERRATWSSVVALVISANVPIVWFSVRWWGGLHQRQSTSESTDSNIWIVLAFNAIAFTVVYIWFVATRYHSVKRRLEVELAEPPALEVIEENS